MSPREAPKPAGGPAETPPREGRPIEAGSKDEAPTSLSAWLEQLISLIGRAFQRETLRDVASAADGAYQLLRSGIRASEASGLDAYGKDPRLVEQLEPWAKFFYERYFRVRVDGADNLPAGPSIIVANHSGALPYDGLVLKRAIGIERPDLREARWLIEDQFFYAAFLGTLLNRLGGVRASPDNAVRLLNEGRPVLVFPEGVHGAGKPFAERYQLQRFGRGGFVKIALRQGVPIVPAATVGAEEALPMFARLPGFAGLPYLPIAPLGPIPLPSRWCIRIGHPMDLSQRTAQDADDPRAVGALTEQVRASIQEMIRALLSERRSIFAG